MRATTEIGLTPVGEGDVLMRHVYALHLIDTLHLLAEILRYGGYGLHEDIADRYPPRTADLLLVELDAHTDLLRTATTQSTKEVR